MQLDMAMKLLVLIENMDQTRKVCQEQEINTFSKHTARRLNNIPTCDHNKKQKHQWALTGQT